jgi:antitoxin (DNA-binding transcriptional repressor) of toxin-antitoxin stability system
MSVTIAIEEAVAKLAESVKALKPGDEIILTLHDQPVAKIVPCEPAPKAPVQRRRAGSCKGMLTIN